MEQIIITRPDGAAVPMMSKRRVTAIKSAKQTWELLGNDVVNINVESPFPQVYGIGDKISVFGRVYKLNRLPKVKKTGTHAFSYDLEFEGVQYDLMRATYDLTINTTNSQLQDVQADSLTGDLRRFATVLTANANRVFGNGVWVLGSCPETDGDKTLTFGEGDNCLSVLQNLCSEFNVEFEIEQTNGIFTINFVEKVGQIFPTTFQFGKGRGLYSLDRQNVDSSNIVTRLKVYGSTSNITHKYRAARLCLPGKSKGQSYIETPEAVLKYGIYEATKYFEDIKPTFNGVVTGIVSGDVLQFVDTNMFGLNERDENGTKYLLNGVSAKIHFNSGNLAGYEFDVHAYDHATHAFTLVKIKDERGDEFPSSISPAFQFAIGDKYKILDIALPPEYEAAAENRLLEAGNTYYEQNSQPKVQYALSVTKAFLQKYAGNGTTVNIFAPGDYIPIKDSDIDVDKSVRIKSLTRNLLDEYEYELTISDTVTTSITNRVISELIDHDKIITINNLKNPARARNNWRNSQELLNMVFDPEGDYYTEKIKPEAIETIALSVGAKSMQFGLAGTAFQPNYNGNKNTVRVTGGALTHYTIDESGVRTWNLADNTTVLGNDLQAYYIYAKCGHTGTAGSVIFSIDRIGTEQDVNFYHFWIGVVSSVDTTLQMRSVTLAYGFTSINGRFIKTGRIESADGETYFDLDNSEIGGNIKFLSSGDYVSVEDGINALDYIKNAIQDGSTEINGGLALVNLLFAKGTDGTVRAGISGLAADNIAFFGGGSYQDALNNIAKIILRKDGSGQMAGGNFWWNLAGEIFLGKYFADKTIIISPTATLPTLAEMNNQENYTLDDYSDSTTTDLNDPAQAPYTRTKQHNIAEFELQNSGTFTVFETGVYVTPETDALVTDLDMLISLEKKNADGSWTVIQQKTENDFQGYYEIELMLSGNAFTQGTYRVLMNYTWTANSEGADAKVTADIMCRIKYHLNVKKLVIASDGISFADSNSDAIFRLSMQDAIPLRYKGASDMPGVLASGSVSNSGFHDNNKKWGAKVATTVSKGGTGIFTVSHIVGHTDYMVIATCTTAGYYVAVTAKSVGSFTVTVRSDSGSPSDVGFDYMIIGAN